jgi:tagatose 1,6-diphosphate aldolase
MGLSPGKIKHMKALSNKDGVIAAAAIDQRGSLQKSIAKERGVPEEQVTPEMLSEFKTSVVRILTPHASAVLLDPEFGLPAAKARASNAGLLLAYEESGYDNTAVGRLPDLLPNVSVKRLIDWGANACKILLYYSPFDDPKINDIKNAFHRAHRRRVHVLRDSVLPRIRGLRSGRQEAGEGLRVRQDQTAGGDGRD